MFDARLVGADGKKITRLDIGKGEEAEAFKRDLELATFSVANIEAKPAKRHPYPPFTTSTLQQEASRKLGLAPAQTMRVAQRLYEGVEIGGETVGLITYMRTDGVDMDPPRPCRTPAGSSARNTATATCRARRANTPIKAKNAQEAHEAIRPTDMGRLPKQVAKYLEPEQARLYELIWTRTIASQMESAELERTTADIAAEVGPRKLDLRATGQVVKFDGFLTLYNESKDDEADEDEGRLPPDEGKGDPLDPPPHRLDPAFHRAAAALLGGEPRQAHGRARHRPALDLCGGAADPARPRICADRQEAARPRGQGPHRHRVPGKLLPPLRGIRFHRRPRRAARPDLEPRDRLEAGPARVLARLLRRHRRDEGAAHDARCSMRSTSSSARTSSRTRATARTRAPARPAARASSR